jgi:hypothetical protein
MNQTEPPELVTEEHQRALFWALMVDRPDGVPEDELGAEMDVVAEWAHRALVKHALLELVMRGEVRLSVQDDEIFFARVSAAGKAEAERFLQVALT